MLEAQKTGRLPIRTKTRDDLSELRNVGPQTRQDFRLLGIESVAELAAQEADMLYARLMGMVGQRLDPCVHDVFAATIHQARTGEALPWWAFTAARKKRQADGTFVAVPAPDPPHGD